MVVVVVVVVVISPGTVVVVVVVVDVVVVDVVDETTVAVVLLIGQEDVATVGRIWSGVMMSGTDVVVVVDDSPVNVVEVSVGASVMGVIARASESAGATAGGSLWSHASSWSTIGPNLFSRAHDATFCCRGSRG
jgi:hypothetical protein